MLKHLNPSMGFGRVYGEWVLALWQSRNGDYILWKDRVPSIHSSCIWFNFFPHFILCTIFFSLYPSLLLLSFCLTSFIWSTLNAWMSYLYMCSCISAHIVGMQRAHEQIYSIMLISIQVYGNYIYISSGVDSVCVCVCADFRVEQEGNIPFHAISNNIIDNMVIIIWMLPKFSTMYKICLSMNEYTIFSNAFPV